MFILLCLTFILSGTATGKDNIQLINNTRFKIINGQAINIRHRPFMVSIHFGNSFICGGTIISSSWVLTAQHCINPNEAVKRHYYIRSGSMYYYKGRIHHLSKVAMLHPENNPDVDGIPIYDIVLLKVTPKFRFCSTVKPAKLPKFNDKIPDKLWMSGWGLTENHELSRKLRIVSLNKVPYNVCFNISSYSRVLIDDQHLCFGGQGFDSCQGDSGGPLADHNTIYGIASFGISECGLLPGVYESVSYYSDWIEYTIDT